MPWQVGDYTTEGEKPFDQGSFGTVWRARRRSDGERVALKLVLLTDAPDAQERIAAERHGAILQQQFHDTHGMVPKVHEVGHDGNDLFIAMELIEGGALSDLVRRGPIDPKLAAEYALRICEFLDKAHKFATTVEGEPYDRLVHADLKPSHILISPDGEIKVLDFGIAKALAKTTQVTTNNWGTSAYASPERLDRGHVNEHVDFWSLGVMLYEMIAGHRPYPELDRNRSQLETAIRTNAPRAPLPLSCPSDLAAIVGKLLAYQPERRYMSAADIKADLQLFLDGKTPSAVDDYIVPETTPIARDSVRIAAKTPPPPTEIPPTDPLPAPAPAVAPSASVAAPVATSNPPAAAAPRVMTRRRRAVAFVGRAVRRAAAVVILIVLIGMVAGEAVGWMAAERFRDSLRAVDPGSLDELRQSYDHIRGWGPIQAGVKLRVNRALKDRLVDVADLVIGDYRREEPTLGPAEWRQAQQALRWATQIAPADSELIGKLLTVEAHVIRLSARTQSSIAARQIYRRAVDRFRAAAEADERSFDPYLGISRVAVYGLDDVDQASAAIEEATKRGYVAGRRERALLGDGFLRRANNRRYLARTLSGEQRRRELERARADYAGCIDAFDPIVGFGYAAKNLEVCKRHLERIELELLADEGRPQGL
jgi:serine/threonine protein kinase